MSAKWLTLNCDDIKDVTLAHEDEQPQAHKVIL